MVLQAGQRVGPYEVLGRLGVGGMGVVFNAWDNRLLREVAIKMLRPEFSTPDMRARFLQEARAVSSLTHPHICTIYDIGEQDGDPYLVMELLRGETLRARLQRQPLAPAELIRIGQEVSDALGAAHRLGVIHRDIKPANIFLSSRPAGGFTTKVLDFGLAKIESQAELESAITGAQTPRPQAATSRGQELTEARGTLGTIGYMSPEQARGEDLDGRSDLFSLGVVLYEAASGEPPFRGATHALTFVQLLSHAPEPIRPRNPEIPAALEDVLLRLLEKDRNHRYEDAAALHKALGEAALHRENGVPQRLWQGAARVLRRTPPEPEQSATEQKTAAAATPSRRQPATQHLRPARPLSRPPVTFSPAGRTDAASRALPPTMPALTPEPVTEDGQSGHPGSPFPWRPAVVAVAVAICLLAGYRVYRMHKIALAVAGLPRVLVPARLDNRTGDSVMSGIVSAGLRIALEQSPHLAIRGREELRASLQARGIAATSSPTREDMQAAALAVGGSDLLLTEMRQDGGEYTLEAHAYDTRTGRESAHAQETATSRDLVVDAIDRLAMDLRGSMGERPAAVARTTVPLRREATANLDALAAFSAGEEAAGNNQMPDALHALLAATSDDPQFTQAWLSLAELYRRQHAALAAGDSALHAAETSRSASEQVRLVAQAAVSLYATGDLPRAAGLLRRALADQPQDDHTRVLLSVALRGQGKFAEAQSTAAEVVAHNPWDFEATGQDEVDLLALDRPEEAERIETEVARSGRRHMALLQLIHYLGSRQNGRRAVDLSGAGDMVAAQEYSAALLDAGGLFSAGMSAWQAIADRSAATPELRGSAADALSSAALDRALIGDCPNAMESVDAIRNLPAAAEGLFREGLAAALCDRFDQAAATLQTLGQAGQRFAVDHFYRADLTAALQMRQGNAVAALATLDRVRDYDMVSPTAYLRGLAHLSAEQGTAAIADFQQVLQHPGATTMINSVLLPMAQFQLARAYAATADAPHSAGAYGAFLDLWHGADANLKIVREAREAADPLAQGAPDPPPMTPTLQSAPQAVR